MKEIVVNTLVFAQKHALGMRQLEMMKKLQAANFKKVEVRREYFDQIELETKEIGEYANAHAFEVFYSVPEKMYEHGKLQLEEIELYFQEARVLSGHYVKMVIGDYEEITEEDVKNLNHLTQTYDIHLTVENDQTQADGTVKKILDFARAFKNKGGNLGITFDSGNWLWTNEDPLVNAKKLSPYVTYYHIKDVKNPEAPQATRLGGGIVPWQEILKELPDGIPVALEYPMGKDVMEVLKEEYKIFIDSSC